MLFYNDSRPGKGVSKRDPNQPRWRVFIDVSPRKIGGLIKLNILYLITSLPFLLVTMLVMGIITSPLIASTDSAYQFEYDVLMRLGLSFVFMTFLGLGPTTAGFTYIIREHASERPCMLISDFFEVFKSKFKQSILLWTIDLIALIVFATAVNFYDSAGIFILKYMMFAIALIYVMMHIYIYQTIVTFDSPLNRIIKNSLLLTIGKAPMNLLILGLNVVLYCVIIPNLIIKYGNLITILITVFFFPAITQFITSFCITPILNKYVNKKEQ